MESMREAIQGGLFGRDAFRGGRGPDSLGLGQLHDRPRYQQRRQVDCRSTRSDS
jgi:hypothetical protein